MKTKLGLPALFFILLSSPGVWCQVDGRDGSTEGAPSAGAGADAVQPQKEIAAPVQLAVEGLKVGFVVNDSMVKNKLLPDVSIGIAPKETPDKAYLRIGKTNDQGRFQTLLPPGEYLVTYRKKGYVSIERTALTVSKDGQQVTTTMSMMLEAAGHTGRNRVQIVLNWGTDEEKHIADLDAHLSFIWFDDTEEVFFGHMKAFGGDKNRVDLDVDDMQYGGPETITLLDPTEGEYIYWVYDYSGMSQRIGQSEVIVRVLIGDLLTEEYRIPTDIMGRHWRPFKALVVNEMQEASLVPFSEQDLKQQMDRVQPPEAKGLGTSMDCSWCDGGASFSILVIATLIFALITYLFRWIRRRSS